MSPKLMIAAGLAVGLVILFSATALHSLTRRGAAICAFVTALTGIAYWFEGYNGAILILASCFAIAVVYFALHGAWGMLQRYNLAEGFNPSDADLRRWLKRTARRSGWVLKEDVDLRRFRLRKAGRVEFQLFWYASSIDQAQYEMKLMFKQAASYASPTLLLLLNDVPIQTVAQLRERKVFPVTVATFPSHLEAASSRAALIESCMKVSFKDSQLRLPTLTRANIFAD